MQVFYLIFFFFLLLQVIEEMPSSQDELNNGAQIKVSIYNILYKKHFELHCIVSNTLSYTSKGIHIFDLST